MSAPDVPSLRCLPVVKFDPNGTIPILQRVALDAAYFRYQACQCTPGLLPVQAGLVRGLPRIRCQPQAAHRSAVTVAVFTIAGAALVAALALGVAVVAMRKRHALGPPGEDLHMWVMLLRLDPLVREGGLAVSATEGACRAWACLQAHGSRHMHVHSQHGWVRVDDKKGLTARSAPCADHIIPACLLHTVTKGCISCVPDAKAWGRQQATHSPQLLPLILLNGAGKGRPLTLVLTEVEGSTELWHWDSAAMAEARKVHDAILHSRLRQHHG